MNDSTLRVAADLAIAATVTSYAAASSLYFLQLGGRTSRAIRLAPWAMGLGVAFHLVHFSMTSAIERACPVEGIHHATNLAALVVALTFLAVSRFWRIESVGAFVAPLATGALLAARFLGAPDPTPAVRSAVLPLHVTAVLLASALFAVASALAATYLLQEKQLKKKKLVGFFSRLPPLDVLDRASHRFLLAGFPLLTLGILIGLLWIGRIHGSEGQTALLRQVLTGFAWLTFAVVLLMRSLGGWRGRRAAWGTIVGFACAALVFIVYLVRSAHPGAL
jgi:ABC-type uncharacterized transport system permease subunit